MDIVERLCKEIGGYTDKYLEKAEADMREAANEIKRLREALKFYAQWTIVSAYIDDEIYDDRGDKARAALKEGE
jgi:hypothetical protein